MTGGREPRLPWAARMQTAPPCGRRGGAALMVALWVLALLTVMVTSYGMVTRVDARLTARQVQAGKARALAEAGIWLAVGELLKPAAGRAWRGEHSLEYGAGQVHIQVRDEAGKVDLNRARAGLLRALLRAAGMTGGRGEALLHAILDWRDRDDVRRRLGAENAAYRERGLDYGAKNGPFNSIEELRLVAGMSEDIFQKLAPALTVYSHRPGINLKAAPPEAAAALAGLAPQPGAGDRAGAGASGQNESGTFTIRSEGVVTDSRYRLDAVVRLRGNTAPFYSVLSWREARNEPVRPSGT